MEGGGLSEWDDVRLDHLERTVHKVIIIHRQLCPRHLTARIV